MSAPYDPAKCQTVGEMLARLGDKWTVLVIMTLGEGPHRFSDVKRRVVGISQRMLTLTLRALERDGLVERTVHPTTPPKVEYALTDLGREFLDPVRTLAEWVMTNTPRMDAARGAYAAKRASE